MHLVCWLKDSLSISFSPFFFANSVWMCIFSWLSIDQNASVIGGEEGGDRKKPPVARAAKQPGVQEPAANGEEAEPERSDTDESENWSWSGPELSAAASVVQASHVKLWNLNKNQCICFNKQYVRSCMFFYCYGKQDVPLLMPNKMKMPDGANDALISFNFFCLHKSCCLDPEYGLLLWMECTPLSVCSG
jgi:hypothetical protein